MAYEIELPAFLEEIRQQHIASDESPWFVYLLQFDDGELKIGRTSNLPQRLRTHTKDRPGRVIALVGDLTQAAAVNLESHVCHMLQSDRREWFTGSVPLADALHRVPWGLDAFAITLAWRYAVATVGRYCRQCSNAFLPKRSDAVFCSDRCRVAAHRGVPAHSDYERDDSGALVLKDSSPKAPISRTEFARMRRRKA